MLVIHFTSSIKMVFFLNVWMGDKLRLCKKTTKKCWVWVSVKSLHRPDCFIFSAEQLDFRCSKNPTFFSPLIVCNGCFCSTNWASASGLLGVDAISVWERPRLGRRWDKTRPVRLWSDFVPRNLWFQRFFSNCVVANLVLKYLQTAAAPLSAQILTF